MFLDRLLETNRALAELALSWVDDGTILPDTYLIDLHAQAAGEKPGRGALSGRAGFCRGRVR